MRKKLPIPVWFLAWIGIGFLAWVVLPLIVREVKCSPEDQTAWHVQSYKSAADQKGAGDYYIATKKKQDNASNNKAGTKNQLPAWLDLLCDEVRLTDIFLLFLTHCLAVLGWWQLRSADVNLKTAERAYVVAGSLFGARKAGEAVDWQMEVRPKGSLFQGPWRLAIYNFGQTPGYVTHLTWGTCPREVFDENVSVSKQISDGTLSGHIRARIKLQYILDPTTKSSPYQFRHVQLDERPVGHVIFGKIVYQDIFREEHFSTFAYHISADYSDGIGDSISDDYD
jgi:hypothetical protein